MNLFDTKLHNSRNRIPSEVNAALVWVHDTLEFCFASAKTHFGDDVSPLIALEIYDRVVQRIDSEKLNEKIIDEKLDELIEQRQILEEMRATDND
ncbi:MAG: hypothetical protein ACRC62_19675 [Microcoleus sp.]